ncbi:Crp/Fnr family transcriptional regulator [Paludibacter jiangxiensis]|uniref:CRP/FNR family transcriptional regulator n=1 Tax=Paludibacter jiangxiensis TaxID=681398 RepID=A0A170ZI87_9BACT|nr:Crp/Fnr family transcriptional regulator [Paludibacter jiangxiensis]GAT62693.1 CRP/FNR family transcriptional regulator [Paludibacter jiangxiensis]
MKTIIETDIDFICDVEAPCFQLLTEEEIAMVRASKTQVFFRKGENLTKQGTFASYVLFVMEGLVKQYVEDGGNRNFNLQVIRKGEFIGLSAVFGESIYTYSATALTDTRVFLIEKDAIAKVIQQNGQFAYRIVKRYCEQNTSLFGTIKGMMFKQMNGHLADALLYLSSEHFGGEDVISLLGRKEIAEFAGISTESTVKLLKTFEKDGIIRLDEKKVSILNRDLLVEISKRG